MHGLPILPPPAEGGRGSTCPAALGAEPSTPPSSDVDRMHLTKSLTGESSRWRQLCDGVVPFSGIVNN